MQTKETKVILVDFFGVLCPDLTDKWLKDDTGAKGKIDRKVLTTIDSKADLDIISDQEYYRYLAKLVGVKPQQIEDYFASKIVINTELLNILKDLKTKYKIIILSNSNSTILHNILVKNRLSSYFDEIIISGEVGYAKPQLEIYKLVLLRFNLDPSEIIYIDDKTENIKAAEKIGIRGKLYIGNNDILKVLSKLS